MLVLVTYPPDSVMTMPGFDQPQPAKSIWPVCRGSRSDSSPTTLACIRLTPSTT